MPSLGRTDSRLRMIAIMLVFAVFGTAAGVRLGYWQVVAADDLTAQVIAVWNASKQVKTERADIVDRNHVTLAKTSSFDSIVAYPDLIDPEDDESLVAALGAILGLKAGDRAEYLQAIEDSRAQGGQWLKLENQISLKQSTQVAEAIDSGQLRGIDLEPVDVRYYPRKGGQPGTSLASHLLGFVRADARGGEGIERYYDDQLTTVDPGLVDLASIDGAADLAGVDPTPLRLTIDAKLQRQVEVELNGARNANRAKSASALIMDPHTGEILAAASVPGYDAEDFAEIASKDIGRLRNRVFSDQYEPGSVMKIFTATAALDLGVVTPNTIIGDQKKLQFWTDTVQNADHKSQGDLKVKDVIAWSRNVATAKIARRLAPNSTQLAGRRLYDLWQKVGMTRRTGVDISSEATGMWSDPDDYQWSAVDLANRAFGQGVSVTLPQLARGVSTLVNGGYLVQPHLAVDGELANVEPKRVLRAKTAREAREILVHVTGSRPWYAEGTLIPGYQIGGKTGTAQIWDTTKLDKKTGLRGGWKDRRFNHSFVGFVGGRKQEYVIAVRLEEPVPISVSQGKIPLELESYEVFQMLARATITQLDMKRSKDPEAGRPIIGTDAAEVLDPVRNREALRQRRQDTSAAKVKAKVVPAEKATRGKDDGVKVAQDPAARSSGSDGT